MDAIIGAIFLILGAIIGVFVYRSRQAPSETIVREVVEQPVEIATTEVAPYWTQYGLPEYWPSYLSPYWYWDVPYWGPITGSGGYAPPRHQWGWGGRDHYAPHGWGGHGPIGGHSGVAVGGGGGGHGGGHGGGGGH